MLQKQLLIIIGLLISFYVMKSQTWTQVGQDIDGDAAGDEFGYSLSISNDGSVLAVGAFLNDGNGSGSGQVKVFQNNAGNWEQIGQDLYGEDTNDNAGYCVGISDDGSTVAVGANYNDGNGFWSGHVRVYINNDGTWEQIGQDIDGEAEYDEFGWSVSLNNDGSVIAAGAYANDGNGDNAGHVRIYHYNSPVWEQVGEDIDGDAEGDYFGNSVCLNSSGNIVAIGAISNDSNGESSGLVKVFENHSGTWDQIGADLIGEAAFDQFGYSVSLNNSGSILAAGAYSNDGNGTNSGHVRVFENNSGTWEQIGEDIDGEAEMDFFGGSVSLSSDGHTFAAGAHGNDGNGDWAGHARVFHYINDNWEQVGEDIDAEAADDQCGISVSLSSDGSIVAVGARQNDGNGSNSGHARIFELFTANNHSIHSQLLFAYPNPANKYFRINGLKKTEENTYIKIVNLTGETVLQKSDYKSKQNINISNLKTGIYIFIIQNDGIEHHLKFIKE